MTGTFANLRLSAKAFRSSGGVRVAIEGPDCASRLHEVRWQRDRSSRSLAIDNLSSTSAQSAQYNPLVRYRPGQTEARSSLTDGQPNSAASF